MKMRISTMLALLCAGCLCAAPSFAANKALSVVGSGGTGTIVGGPGETVAIDIKVDDASMVAGASFTVTFDTDNLTLSSVTSTFFDTFTNQGISPATVTVGSTTYDRPLVTNPTATGCMLAGARVTNGTGTNVTLFTLNFQLNGASGSYPITVVQSTIANTSAGYSATGEQIPALVGVDTASYPTHTMTVIPATLTIGNVDTDNDGIADSWEMAQFGNLTTANATSDYDRDGYSDLQEFLNWQSGLTDPLGAAYDPKTANAPGGEGYDQITDQKAIFSGDFDGNGTLDMLIRDQLTGKVSILFADKSATPVTVFTEANLSWQIKGTADFNGDGKSDILFHNIATSQVYVYLMDGATRLAGSGSPGSVGDLNYAIQTTGDYNGDGMADILWRHKSTGAMYMWFMNGAARSSIAYVFTESNPAWVIKESGDFDGDGKSDILFHNSTTGQAYVYLMNGASKRTGGSPGAASLLYTIQAIGDFDGNGTSDLCWRQTATGQTYIWFMDGTTSTSRPFVATQQNLHHPLLGTLDRNSDAKSDIFWYDPDQNKIYYWKMNGAVIDAVTYLPDAQARTDFNGDGKSDILWRHKTAGSIYMWFMNGVSANAKPFVFSEPNNSWVIKDSGDFNGDGKADILFHNSATGQVYVYLMNGATRLYGGSPGAVSLDYAIQTVGDFNGDGKSDILWRHKTAGSIYMWFMNGISATEKPYVFSESNNSWVIKDGGDFNGDGKADILFRNITTGGVYIYLMNGATRMTGGTPGSASLDYEIQ